MEKRRRPLNALLISAIVWSGISVACIALEPGAEMPQFRLPGLNGRLHDSSEFEKSNILAVIFLSNHCPTSQRFQERLIRLAKDYRPHGFTIVAISPNDPEAILPDELAHSDLGDTIEEMGIRAKELSYPFQYLYDGKTQEAAKAFGARVTPHAFLFNKTRKLCYTGRVGDPKNPTRTDREDLRLAIEALVQDKIPPVVQGRAFGSSIKWSKNRAIVEKVRERFSRETVSLKKADKRTLEFIRENKATWPKLIYVWSIEDKRKRNDLLELSSIHKIYRKRGLEWVTVCIDGETFQESAQQLLKETQASGRNFICPGSELSPLADLRAEKGNRITPYLALVESAGKIAYRSTAGLDPLLLKRHILTALLPSAESKPSP